MPRYVPLYVCVFIIQYNIFVSDNHDTMIMKILTIINMMTLMRDLLLNHHHHQVKKFQKNTRSDNTHIAHSILHLSTTIIFLKVSASVRRGNGALATARMRATVCVGLGAMWTTTPTALTSGGTSIRDIRDGWYSPARPANTRGQVKYAK